MTKLRNLLKYVRFEAFTAVTMKNVVFWDVALCRSSVNRRFGGTYRLHLQGRKICSSETSVNARSTQHHIPEDDILLVKICNEDGRQMKLAQDHA
jgi:hypothetical protein